MTVDGDRLRFVLSAGRTGTAFLREFLKARGGAVVIGYEPPTSRRCWVLWNMAQAGLAPPHLARNIALARRARDAARQPAGTVRLEINSFFSPFVADLCAITTSPHIVHMVRHPFTWIPSMGNFKAAYWRRHVIDHVPFTRIVHPLARVQWSRLPEVLRLAWRWRQANEGIGAAESPGVDYLRVRYEDFVSGDGEVRARTMAAMMTVVDPMYRGEALSVNWEERVNARPEGDVPDWRDWDEELRGRVWEICGGLMDRYGYGRLP